MASGWTRGTRRTGRAPTRTRSARRRRTPTPRSSGRSSGGGRFRRRGAAAAAGRALRGRGAPGRRARVDRGAGDGAVAGLAASYAAGVVSCRPGEARVDRVDVRRGLFTPAPGVPDLRLAQVTYRAEKADASDDLRLSNALQGAMADAEAECALTARTGQEDLLVLDGPLGKRGQLARVLGLVKTHRSRYLPPELHALVAELGPGERTPVFRLTSDWPRYSWYLRLPCRPGRAWSGVVRVECPDLEPAATRSSWPSCPRRCCRAMPRPSTRTRGRRRTSTRSAGWSGCCAAGWATGCCWSGPCAPPPRPPDPRPGPRRRPDPPRCPTTATRT